MLGEMRQAQQRLEIEHVVELEVEVAAARREPGGGGSEHGVFPIAGRQGRPRAENEPARPNNPACRAVAAVTYEEQYLGTTRCRCVCSRLYRYAGIRHI
ncbi:MAG TPA: hypothetical protein VIW69_11300, partial [Candidatus Elarobacter sp.]